MISRLQGCLPYACVSPWGLRDGARARRQAATVFGARNVIQAVRFMSRGAYGSARL